MTMKLYDQSHTHHIIYACQSWILVIFLLDVDAS